MSKRRSHGEGTIFRRIDDGRWYAQVTLEEGKRKTRSFKTQKAAREWLRQTVTAQAQGTYVDPGKLTVEQFLDRWFADVASHTLRPKTLESYKYLLDSHIKPIIGPLWLSQLRPDHLQNLYSRKIDSGLSNRTVQYIHAVIHRALGQALKWDLVARNVMDVVEAPRVTRKAPHALTAVQAKRLLAELAGDRWYALYVLALMTGMRQGELLGLQWEDVDLEKGFVRIRRARHTLRGQESVESIPKSEKSRRSIALPQIAMEVLHSHRHQQEALGITANLVFTTWSGAPIGARNLIRHFKTALKRAGLPDIRFHDLRHTAATLLLSQVTHPKVVQEILGHSQITLTLDTYSHVLPDIQEQAAERMNSIFAE